MAGKRHEERSPAPRLSARCRFDQETFAGTRGNERDAPIPVVRGTAIEPLLSSEAVEKRVMRRGRRAVLLGRDGRPLIVLAAGIIGFVGARAGSSAFQVGGGHGPGGKGVADSESLLGEELPEHARPTVARALNVSAIWLSLWLVPVIAIIMTLGVGHTFSEIGAFFSKMAVVTFGGAY